MNNLKNIIILSVLFVLSACGGGGGGGGNGGSGGNGGGNSSDKFSISTNKLSFNADKSSDDVPVQLITGSVVDVDKTVYVKIDVTTDGISNAVFNFTNSTSGQLSISVKPPRQLSAGTHTDTVTVKVCFDEGCSQPVSGSPKLVTVTYVVTDTFKASLSSALDYSVVAGSSINAASKKIQVYGSNAQWTAKANQSWIKLSQSSGTGVSSIDVSVDKSTLPSGAYKGEIEIIDSTSNTSVKVPVSMELVKPTLTIRTLNPIEFKGGSTADFIPQQFTIELNTGTNTYPWSINLAQSASWLVTDKSSGFLDGSANNIVLGVSSQGLTGRSYSDHMQVDATVNGEIITASLPVSLKLDPHMLFARKHGVALTTIKGVSKLSDTVQIDSNRDLTATWSTAVTYADKSSGNWLTTTTSGNAGGSIDIAANPTGLTPGKIYYATITINSNTSTISNSGTEIIQVGFYVDPSLTATNTTASITSSTPAAMISDPIRPYIYITSGNTDIKVFNVFSGKLEKTLTNIGISLRQLTISDDGLTLFVVDQSKKNIQKINLQTDAITTLQPSGWDNCFNCANNYTFFGIKFVRSAGRSILVSGAPQIIDPDTGDILAGTAGSAPESIMFDVSGNGKSIYAADTIGAPMTMQRYSVGYDYESKAFSLFQSGQGGSSGYARGFWADYDGTKVYRSCWYPNDIEYFSGITGELLSSLSSGSNGGAVLTEQNTLLCMRYYLDFSTPIPDIWEINLSTGKIINEYTVTGEINERQLQVSGDGLRIITRSNDQSVLTFFNH